MHGSREVFQKNKTRFTGPSKIRKEFLGNISFNCFRIVDFSLDMRHAIFSRLGFNYCNFSGYYPMRADSESR